MREISSVERAIRMSSYAEKETIDLVMGTASLDELVYRIEENGTIQVRPLMVGGYFLPAESFWTVIIELDNRFRPSEFNAVFISNPWAEV